MNDTQQKTFCGLIALLGRPNAGKSTLMNALLGQKMAIVSRKPQTTRSRVLGILTASPHQFVFVDTPGLHKPSRRDTRLNAVMNQEAWSGSSGADVVLYLISSVEGVRPEDRSALDKIVGSGFRHVVPIISQADRLKKKELDDCVKAVVEVLKELQPGPETTLRKPMVLSAKRKEDCEGLLALVKPLLPEHPFLYPEDDVGDRPTSFYLGEFVREQLFRQLGQEIPYNCAVAVDKVEEGATLTKVFARIIVSRDNLKGMVLGARGSRIKEIGQAARGSMEEFLEKKVFLELEVVVDPDWMNNDALVREYSSLSGEST